MRGLGTTWKPDSQYQQGQHNVRLSTERAMPRTGAGTCNAGVTAAGAGGAVAAT